MAKDAYPQIAKLAKQQDILRPRDVVAAGLARRCLYEMVAQGKLKRLDRGLYTLPGRELGEHGTWAEAAKRVPRGVICLVSALQFHGLTTQMMPELQVAIKGASWRPRLRYPPLQVFRFTGQAFTHGVEEHAVGGVKVRVYSPAKTVADCFKFRHKLGLDVALEALREVRRAKRATADELWAACQACRVARAIRPYMEALA